MLVTEKIKSALSIYLGETETANRRKAALNRLARAMGYGNGRGAGIATMMSALADGEFMLVPTPDYIRGSIPQDQEQDQGKAE